MVGKNFHGIRLKNGGFTRELQAVTASFRIIFE
jgi:hypothetical protein